MCSFITRVTRDVHETWKNCSLWRCIGYYRPFCPRLGQVVNINLAWYVIMCVTLLIVVFNSAAVGGGGGGDGWGSGFLCFSMFSIVSHGDVLAGSDPFSSETRQACRCVWKNHVFLNPPPEARVNVWKLSKRHTSLQKRWLSTKSSVSLVLTAGVLFSFL